MTLVMALLLMLGVLSGFWVAALGFCLFVGNQSAAARCYALLGNRFVIGLMFAVIMTFFISGLLDVRLRIELKWPAELAMLGIFYFLNASKSRIVAVLNLGLIAAFGIAMFLVK